MFATLRGVAGGKAVDVEAADVRSLIDALAVRYGPPFREEVMAGDDLRPGVVLLVNGVNVRALRGMGTPLTPSDTVAIFPLLGGG